MKFHRVKTENLNSLYGVQTIDFEEDVRGAALFLIVGPTGSGKSTILDAICLALFGQTPRLDRRVGRVDTDVAHIMSIGTANAYAEVEFSTLQADGSRARYLAAWSARRAYDDPEGAVQRPERSLYRKFPDGSMKLVVSDHREKYFQPGFDEALRGLSVHDFKRSILLAQGEFSAFLHASDVEKASILERLTNTDNYRRIGQRAARRRREIDERYRALISRLEEQQILTVPQEQELRAAIDAQSQRAEVARAESDAAAAKVQWLQTSEALEAAVEQATEALVAADANLTARADDEARLARDTELAEVEPAWRELEQTQQRIAAAIAATEPVETRRVELDAQLATVTTEQHDAETAHNAAKQALADAKVSLQRAHELRTRREEREQHAAAARDVVEQKTQSYAKLTTDTEQAEQALNTAQQRAVDATNRVEQLAAVAALAERLPAIQASFEDGVEPLRARVASVRQQRDELRESHTTHARERADLESQLAEGRKERSKWQATLTRAENRLKKSLEGTSATGEVGAVVQELNTAFNAATQRAEALREASYLLERLDAHRAEVAALDARLRTARDEVEALSAEKSQVEEVEAAQRAAVRSSEDALRQNERVIALSAYRLDLHSGNPCPLCGSPIHPYCESSELAAIDAQATADRDRLEADLQAARAALSETNARTQQLASKFVARKTALAKDDARSFAVREALEADQRTFARAAERAGYAPLEAFRLKNAQLLEADLEHANNTANQARASLDAIEQARQAVAAATDKIAASQAQFAEVEEASRALDERLAQLTDRIATREADLAASEADLRQASEQLLAELRDHGVTVDEGETVEQTLQRAEQLQHDVRAAHQALAAANHDLNAHTSAVERLAERRAAAQRELDDARAQLAKHSDALTALNADIAELFGGRDPTQVRNALDDAVAATDTTLEATKRKRAQIAEAIAANIARHEELSRQIAAATQSRDAADAKLSKVLTRLGVERADVESHLLRPDVRRQLRTELDALRTAQVRARDRLADAEKRLDQHLAVARAAPHETLTDAIAALTAARQHAEAVTLELGGLRERWEVHEQTKSRRGALEDELRGVQHDLDVWNTIYSLIGTRDGESFKLFAQSLNLQGLVDNANTRLQRLHARYELTVARGDAGEPTLSFKVRDRYQANAERPLTTLSGGETFLVSLALALGLADFRRIDMPIETLLLDEGFGALDQDSLHMALTTLHQLHRDASRQIGIISHVDALRELIDARIILEPRGHGRSTIRFEFGAHAAGPPLELLNR